MAMTIIVLVIVGLAAIAVGIRTMVRMADNIFGLDDWLIVGGLVVYIADTGLAVHGISRGIGSKNDKRNDYLQAESQKFDIIWITVYVCAVALIKTSVCLTMQRIAEKSNQIIRYAIWSLFFLTWASFCVTFFGILTFCRPVEANWDTYLVLEGKATCAGTDTLIGISHTNTATSIITDVGCIVMPGIMLWKTHMSVKKKLQVSCLLSLASVVSRGAKRGFTNPTDRGITSTQIKRGDNNWERLSDEDSDKEILVNGQNGIRADFTYSVEMESYSNGKPARGAPM
ncbi:hypothetical protein F53441_9257 [Fusarium austroafricanum]|uniref:Rhodopsin domain-containing protein n=1 Tax=Fusarium austroafricanum TaxID=2364996 RepID=A0A8H4NQD2_9HYPO|nr:hypothetical protein F53441_9257 [Fusarium austroafricanum]